MDNPCIPASLRHDSEVGGDARKAFLAALRDRVSANLRAAGLGSWEWLPEYHLDDLTNEVAVVWLGRQDHQFDPHGTIRTERREFEGIGSPPSDALVAAVSADADELCRSYAHLRARDDALLPLLGRGQWSKIPPAWAWLAHPLAIELLRHLGIDPADTVRFKDFWNPGEARAAKQVSDADRGLRVDAEPNGVRIHHVFSFLDKSPFSPIAKIRFGPDNHYVMVRGEIPETLRAGAAGLRLGELIDIPGLTNGPFGKVRIVEIESYSGGAAIEIAPMRYAALAKGPKSINKSFLRDGWRPPAP